MERESRSDKDAAAARVLPSSHHTGPISEWADSVTRESDRASGLLGSTYYLANPNVRKWKVSGNGNCQVLTKDFVVSYLPRYVAVRRFTDPHAQQVGV